MADIMRETDISNPASPEKDQRPQSAEMLASDLRHDLIRFAELFFFAYRDFISDPDAILLKFGFGRAHHRVLHFVHRHPGMRVADLLEILKITKQSLARVLKQLVDEGYIAQQEGESDRRQRLLFTTEKGEALAETLSNPQLDRITKALESIGPEGEDMIRHFLYNMITEDERPRVEKVLVSEPFGPEKDEN